MTTLGEQLAQQKMARDNIYNEAAQKLLANNKAQFLKNLESVRSTLNMVCASVESAVKDDRPFTPHRIENLSGNPAFDTYLWGNHAPYLSWDNPTNAYHSAWVWFTEWLVKEELCAYFKQGSDGEKATWYLLHVEPKLSNQKLERLALSLAGGDE